MEQLELQQSNSQLVQIVQTSGLEPTKSQFILDKFQDYFQMAAEWEAKLNTLNVTDVKQVKEMKIAADARKYLKAKRIEVEHTRKNLKEQSLREGKAIDGISNVLKALIEPLEEKAEQIENFAFYKLEAEKQALKEERENQLSPYTLNTSIYDLSGMTQEQFEDLLEGLKFAKKTREEAEKKAAKERAEAEKKAKEQEALIRKENERLKAIELEKEKQLLLERKKHEATIKKAREEAEKLNALNQAKIKAEQEKAKKLQEELRAKELEEERRIKAEKQAEKERLAAEKKEAAKPFKERLKKQINEMTLDLPISGTSEIMVVAGDIMVKFNGFKKWALSQIENV